MIGVTLSPEQIRQAPPEVRRWIERQVAGALGLSATEPAFDLPERHLTRCSRDEARAILSLIHGLLPVVGVFFELGREPVAAFAQGIRALPLDEIARHVRLHSLDQVVACLRVIDEAMQQVSGQPDAALTALDAAGHCLVADATAQSILALWQEIVAARNLARPDAAPTSTVSPIASPPFRAPYSMSVPAFAAPPEAGNGSGTG